MPSPQSLVTFVATLFLTLLATRVQFDMPPVRSALVSTAIALVLGGLVALRTRGDDEDDDDVTLDSRTATMPDEPQ